MITSPEFKNLLVFHGNQEFKKDFERQILENKPVQL